MAINGLAWTRRALALGAAAALAAAPALGADGSLPRIASQGGRHALIVDGSPFLLLGAQVNNSSAFSPGP